MGKLITIAAVAQAGFFRAGRRWPHEGETIAVTDLTEADLDRIMADPNLRVTDPDGRAMQAEASDAPMAALAAAIGKLEPGDFGQDGKPKLEPLRAALPEHKAAINAALRDQVWDALTNTTPQS